MNENKTDFLNEIQNILKEDCSQTSNEPRGTDINILQEKNHLTLTLKNAVSPQTLRNLIATNYLIGTDDTGRVYIQSINIK